MKQKIIADQGLLSKNKANAKKISRLMSACLNLYDYKVLCHLLADMSYEGDSESFDVESFFHRLGKLTDVKFEEENKEGTNANITM